MYTCLYQRAPSLAICQRSLFSLSLLLLCGVLCAITGGVPAQCVVVVVVSNNSPLIAGNHSVSVCPVMGHSSNCTPSTPPLRLPLLRSDGQLIVSIQLNGTAFNFTESASVPFLLALRRDLHESVLPELPITPNDDSSFSASSTSAPTRSVWDVPRCAMVEIPNSPSRKRVLRCVWRPPAAAALRTACQERLWSIIDRHVPPGGEPFARASDAYRAMTGDARRLRAVGGACYLASAPAGGGACGSLSCIAVAMSVLAGVVGLVLVGAAAYCCVGRRRAERPSPARHAPHPDAREAVGYTHFDRYDKKRSAEEETIAGSAAKGSHGHTFSSSAAPAPPSEEGTPVNIAEYLLHSLTHPVAISTGSASPNPSPPNATHKLSHEKRGGSSSGRRDGNGSHKGVTSENGRQSGESTSKEDGKVNLSLEEREQLQRQRSWLCDHVDGLDAL